MIVQALPQADPALFHPEQGCITCGDVATPMRVHSVDDGGASAVCVDEGGVEEEVAIDLVSPVAPGDALLVHARVALTRLEPEVAL